MLRLSGPAALPAEPGQPRCTPQDRRNILHEHHNLAWLRLWDACCAYFYALLGKEDHFPETFRTHQLESMNFLAPALPMMQLIENQVYLTQQEWAKVIGRSEKLLHTCGLFHYESVSLYIRIQTSAAYAMLNKRAEAARLLCETLFEAKKDGLALPLAENYRYLAPLLQACPQMILPGASTYWVPGWNAAAANCATARPPPPL